MAGSSQALWVAAFPPEAAGERLRLAGKPLIVPDARLIAEDKSQPEDLREAAAFFYGYFDEEWYLHWLAKQSYPTEESQVDLWDQLRELLPTTPDQLTRHEGLTQAWLAHQLNSQAGFGELVLSLFDQVMHPEVTPQDDGLIYQDPRLIKWFDRLNDLDLDQWLEGHAPKLLAFRREFFRERGVDPLMEFAAYGPAELRICSCASCPPTKQINASRFIMRSSRPERTSAKSCLPTAIPNGASASAPGTGLIATNSATTPRCANLYCPALRTRPPTRAPDRVVLAGVAPPIAAARRSIWRFATRPPTPSLPLSQSLAGSSSSSCSSSNPGPSCAAANAAWPSPTVASKSNRNRRTSQNETPSRPAPRRRPPTRPGLPNPNPHRPLRPPKRNPHPNNVAPYRYAISTIRANELRPPSPPSSSWVLLNLVASWCRGALAPRPFPHFP